MKFKLFTLMLLIAFSPLAFGQKKPINPKAIIGETYLVKAELLNVRNLPNKNSDLVATSYAGNTCELLTVENNDWWYVKFDGEIYGYVKCQYLKLDRYSGWNKQNYQSGESPQCENIQPAYDYAIKNYLRVNVGSNADVVVKLMKKEYSGDAVCIRLVYIKAGETYNIENIPEGNYFLKMAYGKDWRQKVINGQCVGKFMSDAMYCIGKERFNYNIERTSQGQSVPSYTLSLDVIKSYGSSNFNKNSISESDFNK